MTGVTFDLPFPAKILWPNGRGHWAEKARAVKAARHAAWLTAWTADVKQIGMAASYFVAITVHPKTRNLIDRDNVVASLKSYLDGIADALGVDDRTFETPVITFGEPIKGGLMRVTLRPHSKSNVGE